MSETPDQRRRAQLARTIEAEIIPRLMLAHSADAVSHQTIADVKPVSMMEHVPEFAELVVKHDAAVATSYLEAMRVQGATLENIFLELLAPTARHLGKLWEEDINNFTDVTVGLSRLQQLVRQLSPGMKRESADRSTKRRALIVPLPGEQHTFGVFMVEEFFRREGWDVAGGPPASLNEVVGLASSEWFDVVGFSVSREQLLDKVASVIRSIRRSSRNRQVCILVGGRLFLDKPDLVTSVGADGTAVDGRQAVLKIPQLINRYSKQM